MSAVRVAGLAIGLALLTSTPASGWDIKRTHERLADAAIDRFNREEAFDRYLREQLALPDGTLELLAIQRGLDADIDEDLFSSDVLFQDRPMSRLVGSFNQIDDVTLSNVVDFEADFAPAPNNVGFDIGTDAGTEGIDIRQLIRVGVYAEDNPNPRSRHHFHDPERPHAPPTGNHGLDNDKPALIGLAELATEAFTVLARGGKRRRGLEGLFCAPFQPFTDIDCGNFALTGLSSVDRALNTPRDGKSASDRDPRNFFALPDAERYLFLGLAATSEEEREHYLALHFLAFGHVLHLLQDAASPAHTRNDFIEDHLRNNGINIEGTGGKRSVLDSVMDGLERGALNPASRPRLFLIGLADVSPYVFSVPRPATSAFDIADFWDQGAFADPSGDGLAELVHNNFFSEGSISNDTGLGGDGYAAPDVPGCSEETDTGQPVFVADLPERNVVTGELKEPSDPRPGELPPRYLSSSLVPHLARCSLHSRKRFGATRARTTPVAHRTVIDGSVQRDYLELLFPIVIHYSANFVESYFAPRIDVVPVGGNAFVLENLSHLPFEAQVGAIQAFYDDASGERHEAFLDCGDPDALMSLAPAGEPGDRSQVQCSFSTPLAGPEPRDRGEYFVVVRGALGQRGSVGSVDEFDDGSKDFVIAFQRVFGRSVLFQRETPGMIDGEQAQEIMMAGVAPANPDALETLPEPISLSDPLRSDPEFDFGRPWAEPNGTRFAFESDREVMNQRYPNDPSGNPIIDGADRHVFLMDALQGEPSLLKLTSDPRTVGVEHDVVWADTGDAVFFWENDSGSDTGERTLYRVDPTNADPLSTKVAINVNLPQGCDTTTGAEVTAFSVERVALALFCNNPQPVLGSGWDLYVMDITGTTATALNKITLSAIESCSPQCSLPADFSQEGRFADFSPDGSQLAFDSRAVDGPTGALGEQHLFVADLQSGTIRTLDDERCSGRPAWSSDGKWIAYASVDSCAGDVVTFFFDLFVVEAEGGDPRPLREFTDGLSRARLTWFEPLLLP